MKFKPGYLILLLALFWLCTTRQGTSWGDDWAMYVHQAQNIAEGKTPAQIVPQRVGAAGGLVILVGFLHGTVPDELVKEGRAHQSKDAAHG